MNVIVFSKRMGRARQFEVNRLQMLAITALLLVGVMSIAFFAGNRFGPSRVELE